MEPFTSSADQAGTCGGKRGRMGQCMNPRALHYYHGVNVRDSTQKWARGRMLNAVLVLHDGRLARSSSTYATWNPYISMRTLIGHWNMPPTYTMHHGNDRGVRRIESIINMCRVSCACKGVQDLGTFHVYAMTWVSALLTSLVQRSYLPSFGTKIAQKGLWRTKFL